MSPDELDLLTEAAVRPQTAASYLQVAMSTLYLYLTKGVKLPGGEVVILESYRIGRKRLIPVPGLKEFAAKNVKGFGKCPQQTQ